MGGDASEVGGGGDSREIDESGAGTGAQAMQRTLLLPAGTPPLPISWYSPVTLLGSRALPSLGPSKR